MSRPREAPRPAADWHCQTCHRFPALPGLPVCSRCRAREPREEPDDERRLPHLVLRKPGPAMPWAPPLIPGAEYLHPSLLAEPARQALELNDDEDLDEEDS